MAPDGKQFRVKFDRGGPMWPEEPGMMVMRVAARLKLGVPGNFRVADAAQ